MREREREREKEREREGERERERERERDACHTRQPRNPIKRQRRPLKNTKQTSEQSEHERKALPGAGNKRFHVSLIGCDYYTG